MIYKTSYTFKLIIAAFAVILLNISAVIAQDADDNNTPDGPVTVNASVNHNEATIGEKVRFTITVESDPDIEVVFPGFKEKLADLTVKNHGRTEPKNLDSGKIKQKEWYDLETFTPGSYVIPPLTVKYRLPNSEGDNYAEVNTNEIFVEIKSLISGDETAKDIKEIKGPVDIAINYFVIYLIIGGAFGVAGIAFGVIYFIKQRNKNKVYVPPPPLPAHEIAYMELKHLAELDLISKGMVKEYFSRLSNILRHYIEKRFAIMAPERTTEEFFVEMSRAGVLEQDHKELVSKFLEKSDLVKFAKYGPNNEEIDGALQAATRLIDETKFDMNNVNVTLPVTNQS